MNTRRFGSAASFHRRRWKRRFPLLLLLVLCGCAYAIVRGDTVNLTQVGKIEDGIQNLRQLTFKSSVPTVVMSPDQAEQVMADEIDRDYPADRIKLEESAGALVGLYPRGMDLKASALNLLKSQVAGFYEPDRKEMILVSGVVDVGFWARATEFLMQRDVVGEMLLAHELTHALQDQNFQVNDKLEAIKDNDDRLLALKSVAEGDATIAGFAYAIGRMDDASVDQIVGRLAELPEQFATETKGAPSALSAPLIFQYVQGSRFVAEAFHRGGWKAVDALYLNPPLSSRQLIHPSLYFDHPTSPVEIHIGGYQSLLAGWTKADANTLGEVLLQVMLRRNLGAASPDLRLADRWAGDRMILLSKGDAVTVIWVVVFTDGQSAARFAKVYGEVLDRIDPGTPHGVNQKADAVLVMAGPGAGNLATLAPAIWKATKITRPAPGPAPAIRAGRASAVESAMRRPAGGAALPTASPRPSL